MTFADADFQLSEGSLRVSLSFAGIMFEWTKGYSYTTAAFLLGLMRPLHLTSTIILEDSDVTHIHPVTEAPILRDKIPNHGEVIVIISQEKLHRVCKSLPMVSKVEKNGAHPFSVLPKD